MRIARLVLAITVAAAFILPTGGCSSETDKTPKVSGGNVDPNLKPMGRSVGGGAPAGKPASGSAPVEKP